MKKEEREELDKLFEVRNPKICSICGKPSLPNFYGACCKEHAEEYSDIFVKQVGRAFKNLPKVKLHF